MREKKRKKYVENSHELEGRIGRKFEDLPVEKMRVNIQKKRMVIKLRGIQFEHGRPVDLNLVATLGRPSSKRDSEHFFTLDWKKTLKRNKRSDIHRWLSNLRWPDTPDLLEDENLKLRDIIGHYSDDGDFAIVSIAGKVGFDGRSKTARAMKKSGLNPYEPFDWHVFGFTPHTPFRLWSAKDGTEFEF